MILTNPKNFADKIDSPMSDLQAIEITQKIVAGTHALCSKVKQNTVDFLRSLLGAWKSYRGLSESQRFYLHRTIIIAMNDANRPEPVKVELEGGHTKILSLFGNASKSGLKHPKLRFDIPILGEVRLSVAGERSRSPGAINVTDGGRFGENTWYGRVTLDGEFIINTRCTPEQSKIIASFMKLLAKNPAWVASVCGRHMGRCCFCGLELTDERSLLVGYGPVCAEKWVMPWGARPEHDAEDELELYDILKTEISDVAASVEADSHSNFGLM